MLCKMHCVQGNVLAVEVPPLKALSLVLLLLVGPLAAQERPAPAANPLAQLKDEVKRVLADAALPFTDEQEKAIILMMEDRRKASEDLFGDLMDFQAGPTRGEESDRLRSAIEWMRNEFLSRLQDYLRPEQLAIWSRHLESGGGRQDSSAADTWRRTGAETAKPNAVCSDQQQCIYRRRWGLSLWQ